MSKVTGQVIVVALSVTAACALILAGHEIAGAWLIVLAFAVSAG